MTTIAQIPTVGKLNVRIADDTFGGWFARVWYDHRWMCVTWEQDNDYVCDCSGQPNRPSTDCVHIQAVRDQERARLDIPPEAPDDIDIELYAETGAFTDAEVDDWYEQRWAQRLGY